MPLVTLERTNLAAGIDSPGETKCASYCPFGYANLILIEWLSCASAPLSLVNAVGHPDLITTIDVVFIHWMLHMGEASPVGFAEQTGVQAG